MPKTRCSKVGPSIGFSSLLVTTSCYGRVPGNNTSRPGTEFLFRRDSSLSPPHCVFRGQWVVHPLELGHWRLKYRRLRRRSCRSKRAQSVERSSPRHFLYLLEPFIQQLPADICWQYLTRRRLMNIAEANAALIIRVERQGDTGRCGWCRP